MGGGGGGETDGGATGGSGSTPIVTTLAATSITPTSAILNGTAIPNGLETQSWFEYGTEPSLATYTSSPKQNAGNGLTSQAANMAWNGLVAGTTYYFRFCAENSKGYSKGAIISFTASSPGSPPTVVTVRPIETSDILYNPGMGFADFHFGWGNPPPAGQYPPQTVAYFRWTWDELEPSEGQYNFGMVDSVIEQAKAKGETLAFRIMSVYEGSTPKWVRDKGVDSVTVGSDIFPDHNNPVFLDYHERLVKAFGNRYAGTPEIDHVDIGSVGCWGEWNTACCGTSEALCTQYFPTDPNKLRITDWYFQYFPGTPLVMLVGGPVEYAASKGAGWRGDCFGDYGIFDPTWNHMVDVYEPAVQIPLVGSAWKAGPVQFEVCGVMQDWYDLGFNIDLILQKGLDWHMTVLNAKSSPVPAAWRSKVDEFLKRVGYRFVLQELTHATEARPGGSLTVRSLWENKGVAPIYHPWPLAYRLRSSDDLVVASWKSTANLMSWLPGTHEVDEVVTMPASVPAAIYALDVAILTEDAKDAHVEIAIVGKRPDKWYPVSEVTIKN
jgi:hypothetical protein